MITPAQQHWQNVMAQRAGRANEGVDHAARTAHEEVLYRLRLAQARLKGVQARSAKADIKKALLPDFSGWIEGTLEADGGQQDEVIATLMVWAIDCGDLPLALRIGAYAVRHNLIMPDNFGRTAATVLTEEICNPVLTQAGTDADADLSVFIEPLDTLWEIVANQDMPDEVRAKLCKACAFARRGLSDADSMASSLKLLREAMHLNQNAGVKREIATLSRALKKADSAAAPEDASAQQAQDESSESKKTTRKPATRKTTATQKAKPVYTAHPPPDFFRSEPHEYGCQN
ncbi:Phage terminase, endonuclease small subunit M [Shigella sonnei]|uniref:phage terminase small subunit n=2 Tax=Shigella sonnei TaxID=624 RepID=UPI000972F5FA|nr:phage terminase small subunit [Shigella sonnei]SJE42952.1 Phage terminase, endonuclease small subunit M [Shigella sonnei]